MRNGIHPVMIIIVAISLSFASCFSFFDGRYNTLVKQKSNPLRSKKAVLFLMNAPSVSDSYQVSIVSNDFKLNNDIVGNTFTVDTNHGDTWLDSSSINLLWLGNDTLQIDYDKKLRTFIMENRVDNVIIDYKPR